MTKALILIVAAGSAAAQLPERLEDSQKFRDEQYWQMDRYLTDLVLKTDSIRAEHWKRLDFSNVAAYDRSAARYRKEWMEFLGVPEPGKLALNPRREKVAEMDTHTAYRVWLDALPGVQAYGILLIPKNVSGKRPGLLAVHGQSGSPEIVAGFLDPNLPSGYRRFGETAVKRGFVVWCPYNYGTYSEENEPNEGPQARGRNILNKKALLTDRTVMGLEIAKLRRGVDYLASLPEVDSQRIGMYGLSKGGHYTLYTAALEPRIQAAVVSGWFNQRTRKLLAPKVGNKRALITHLNREEYYLKGLLNRFGDAELGWMIAPRALMIEAGTEDGGVSINDAHEEFLRVEQTYKRLGLSEKARFAKFEGPHRIDGVEAFPFLDKWLGNNGGAK